MAEDTSHAHRPDLLPVSLASDLSLLLERQSYVSMPSLATLCCLGADRRLVSEIPQTPPPSPGQLPQKAEVRAEASSTERSALLCPVVRLSPLR